MSCIGACISVKYQIYSPLKCISDPRRKSNGEAMISGKVKMIPFYDLHEPYRDWAITYKLPA